MKKVLLRSTRRQGCIPANYNEPIEMGKLHLADGVFLCDLLIGTLYAKEVEPGVYENLRLPGHYMSEAPLPDPPQEADDGE